MLRLPDACTWDFWLADTGGEYHLFSPGDRVSIR
jgi:hypothetical protein